jgi:uroporphyrinogen decarboxylase
MNIIKILNKEKSKVNYPIWLMRQAGRYLPEYRKIRETTKGFLDLCYSPDLACEVTLQPIRRFDLDAAIIFSDILVVPDSMGIKVDFVENEGPLLGKIQNKNELNHALAQKKAEKLLPVYQAITKTRSALDKEKALIGFSGGAWTLASYIVEGRISKDLSIAKALYYNDKAFFNQLIDHLVENIAEHLIKQIDAGVDLIQIFDSWAGVLTGDDYDQLIIKPTKEIIKLVRQAYPNVPIICFPRGSSFQYEKFCLEVDCQGISIDQYMPLKLLKDKKNQKIIQGNLDPLILLSNSTDLIRQRIDAIFDGMEKQDFIFNLGHGVVPKTPPENVEFMVNYVKGKR